MIVCGYAIVEPTMEDRQRIAGAIKVMQEIVDGVGRIYGTYEGYGVLDDAVKELENILKGKQKY